MSSWLPHLLWRASTQKQGDLCISNFFHFCFVYLYTRRPISYQWPMASPGWSGVLWHARPFMDPMSSCCFVIYSCEGCLLQLLVVRKCRKLDSCRAVYITWIKLDSPVQVLPNGTVPKSPHPWLLRPLFAFPDRFQLFFACQAIFLYCLQCLYTCVFVYFCFVIWCFSVLSFLCSCVFVYLCFCVPVFSVLVFLCTSVFVYSSFV